MRRLLPFILSITLSLLALVPGAASAAPKLDEVADLSGPPAQMTSAPTATPGSCSTAPATRPSPGSSRTARSRSTRWRTWSARSASPAARTRTSGRRSAAASCGFRSTIRRTSEEHRRSTGFNGQGITNGPGDKLYAIGGDQFISFSANNPAGFDADTITGMDARGLDEADGKLWAVDFGGSDIIRIDPDGEDFKRFNVGGGPQQVVRRPQWPDRLREPRHATRRRSGGSRATTSTRRKDPSADPFGIEFAGDGNWWIGQFNKVGMGILQPDGKLKQFKDLPDRLEDPLPRGRRRRGLRRDREQGQGRDHQGRELAPGTEGRAGAMPARQ